ncbi:uncharacterized protein PG998_013806 [Apiospora kogelbergensis]|uniref:uncharacterized protein n=1 Tax=Apiospora kogelbergensis TaxID=1337665 RepID=UPI0031327367
MVSPEPDERSSRRRPSDIYGGIATVAESGLPISPTSEWDLKQKRIWPPAPYQAYCEKHFLHECLVYFSLQMEKFESEEEKRKENQTLKTGKTAPVIAASKETQPKPTRVQPGRRAKGTSFPPFSASAQIENYGKGGSAVVSSSSPRRRTYQEFSDDQHGKMERRQELCLDISWAKFQGGLQALIKRTNKKLGRKQAKKSSPHATGASDKQRKKKIEISGADQEEEDEEERKRPLDGVPYCPLQGLIKVECRYCDHRPEIRSDTDNTGDPSPTRAAPVAPMHILQAGDFDSDQICTFGGLTFAVDVCGGIDSAAVVLIEMRNLDQGTEPEGDGEKEKHDSDDNLSMTNRLPSAAPNKRVKTGKGREDDPDLNWIPEEETD